jgi:hypothetical protein
VTVRYVNAVTAKLPRHNKYSRSQPQRCMHSIPAQVPKGHESHTNNRRKPVCWCNDNPKTGIELVSKRRVACFRYNYRYWTLPNVIMMQRFHRWSQWPCDPRRDMSSSAQTLVLCARIPIGTWMFAFICFCSHVWMVALRRADPPSKESYRLSIRLMNY